MTRRKGFVLVAGAAIVWSIAAAREIRLHAQTIAQPIVQPDARASQPPRSGRDIFQAACAACHGDDGRGRPQTVVGFDVPLPDFTDCAFSTPEVEADWLAIVHEGGPVRAFDRHMPSFGDALTVDEIRLALGYVQSLCGDTRWPRGELNLPRAFVTEKAFPENEAVWTIGATTGGQAAVSNQFLYEHRLGSRAQWELSVPIELQRGTGGGWQRGLGDVSVALKQVLFHSLQRGTILSAGGELALPTGKESNGLGAGVTRVEPFLAWGQILPADTFVQVQTGAEIPFDRERAETETFFRTAFGKTFVRPAWGRNWTPIVELAATREDDETLWNIVPQMQVSLSRRQHILISGGVNVPLNERAGRSKQLVVYLLWDWFDGGLFEGWR